MPRQLVCECGGCHVCRQRECMRLLRQERRRTKDVVWPQDHWGEQARAEAEWLSRYVCPLADIEAARWAIQQGRKARRAGAK